MIPTILFKTFRIVPELLRLLSYPAVLGAFGMSLYHLYIGNCFSAMVFMFMANMLLNERRYSTLKDRLDAHSYL